MSRKLNQWEFCENYIKYSIYYSYFPINKYKSVEQITITKKRIISLATKFADFNMFLFITF